MSVTKGHGIQITARHAGIPRPAPAPMLSPWDRYELAVANNIERGEAAGLDMLDVLEQCGVDTANPGLWQLFVVLAMHGVEPSAMACHAHSQLWAPGEQRRRERLVDEVAGLDGTHSADGIQAEQIKLGRLAMGIRRLPVWEHIRPTR